MEKLQETNKLSKMRIVLALLIGIFLTYHIIEMIKQLSRFSHFSGGSYPNYFDFSIVILQFTGTILFAIK